MRRQSEALMPIANSTFLMCTYASSADEEMPHIAMIAGPLDTTKPVLVRIHSECLTGDLFGSKRCDCGEQLSKSLDLIAAQKGVLIYLRQEGRGIGLINKLKAYQLQDKGLNTADANLHLGFDVDSREYEIAFQILLELGVKQIDLLTNSPRKITAFEDSGIEINKRIPLIIDAKPENKNYLDTKKNLMGHLLDI